MGRPWRLALAFAGAVGLSTAGDFLGPEACAPCHSSQYDRQARARHARALRPILESPLPTLLTGHSFDDRSGASLEYAAAPGGVAVTARKGGDQGSALLEWAFGAGAQGITPVGRFEGRYFEHRLSWYEEPKRLAVTFGHPARGYGDARSAVGLPQSDVVIYRCFHCHATGVERGFSGPDLTAMRPGVTCERCHGPGRSHAEAVRAGRPKEEVARAILNPGRFPGKAQVEMCGECHRLPEPGEVSPAPETLDPIAVRFQPIGLPEPFLPCLPRSPRGCPPARAGFLRRPVSRLPQDGRVRSLAVPAQQGAGLPPLPHAADFSGAVSQLYGSSYPDLLTAAQVDLLRGNPRSTGAQTAAVPE